ncbi:hypothetical protein B0H19DRAFT_442518 [Mycena capillaripes]|nr:hypothetical protein B0H19DRAFT_442518 [Mycena capillaripes]
MPCEDNAQKLSIDVLFPKFSTGHPHPLATQPTLHIHTVPISVGLPGISIEIVGENLAISLVYWREPTRDLDSLHIFNWYSGLPKMAPMGVTNTGLVFLTPSTLLVPNTASASFDVFHIPPSPPPSTASVPNIDTDTVPFLFCSFLLQGLPPWQSLISFQCRGTPNPLTSPARRSAGSGARFTTRHNVDVDPSTEHMFVLDRARFLPLLLPDAPEADSGIVPWHT